ncbi:MAG: serine/threonine protein kinase, partial [Planctomycetes bacterium]|nr:serine/threonine protein kinase [Planctomycetota bacterium]
MTENTNNGNQLIPGYEIIGKLGQGGMGTVYKARQTSMQRDVALKILPKRLARQKEFKDRFFREAKAAGQLNHGNIVAAIDAQEVDGYCYIAMEMVDGMAVADLINTNGPIPEKEALNIGLQIANGLAHAWQAGIVHRDVKPENFLYTAEKIAKLCDLGIAKAPSDSSLTQEGMAIGTPLYISPEQAQGKPDVDFRADIYSLGASLYHMIAGEPPFDGPSGPSIMLKHIPDPLPPLRKFASNVSPATSRLIAKMMSKDPIKRYQSAETLITDIKRAMDGA